ncbi:MAG: hypothetical protein J0626_11875, partial [Rhodospirillaceae bacterium]|nr:hypothetical protein [Rhodospirillaceae bacterium]
MPSGIMILIWRRRPLQGDSRCTWHPVLAADLCSHYVLSMDTSPKPFDSNAPLGERRAIIRRNPDDAQEIEMIEAAWGS